jgi:hypothetical protein
MDASLPLRHARDPDGGLTTPKLQRDGRCLKSEGVPNLGGAGQALAAVLGVARSHGEKWVKCRCMVKNWY